MSRFSQFASPTDLPAVSSGGGGKIFSPGLHTVKVSEVKDLGVSTLDVSWANFMVTYKASDSEKAIRDFVVVPTVSDKFGTEGSNREYAHLINFLFAIGETVTATNIKSLIIKHFENPQKLVGKTTTIRVGYKGYSVKYVSGNHYELIDYKGEVASVDANGSPEVFASRTLAETDGVARWGKRFKKFPDVTGFGTPVTTAKKVAPKDDVQF